MEHTAITDLPAALPAGTAHKDRLSKVTHETRYLAIAVLLPASGWIQTRIDPTGEVHFTSSLYGSEDRKF